MRGYWKGYAGSRNIQNQIVRSKIVDLKCTIVIVDVATDDNLADIGTRPDREYSAVEREHRRRNTLERMSIALEKWFLCGETFVSRHVVMEDVIQEENEM